MKENSIEEDILNIEKYVELVIDKNYCDCNELNVICAGNHRDGSKNVAYSIQHILSDYKRVLKENKELKNEVMEKDLEIIGKEEYTKASMKEIIEQYYTANEECISKQIIKDKIEEILNNGEYRIIFEGDAEFPDEATCIDAQKYIKLEKLQELLEGRK